MDEFTVAINMPSVVLDSATHLYRGWSRSTVNLDDRWRRLDRVGSDVGWVDGVDFGSDGGVDIAGMSYLGRR
jgi:hypothetical protein